MPETIIGLLTDDELTEVIGEALIATGKHEAGHGRRSALIGLETGTVLGLDAATLSVVKYGGQVEAAGCPTNDMDVRALLGRTADVGAFKRAATIVHPDCLLTAPALLIRGLFGGASFWQWPRQLLRLIAMSVNSRAQRNYVYRVRCTAGTHLLREMGYADDVVTAVDFANEHWDGSGAPYGLSGQAIPLASQLILLGRFADSVALQKGVGELGRLLDGMPGRWFSREVRIAFKAINTLGLWTTLKNPLAVRGRIGELSSDGRAEIVTTERLDRVTQALAEMQSLRDPYTGGHQPRVAKIAVLLARTLGLPDEQVKLTEWSALLHDLGKLAVALELLLKQGKFTADERRRMEIHPALSASILGLVPALREVAAYAGAHHERYEGGGYPTGQRFPFGLDERGDCRNPLIACVVCLADTIDALLSTRPYPRENGRFNFSRAEALALITGAMRGHFHPDCLEAMSAVWDAPAFLAIVSRCERANEDLKLRLPEEEFAAFARKQCARR